MKLDQKALEAGAKALWESTDAKAPWGITPAPFKEAARREAKAAITAYLKVEQRRAAHSFETNDSGPKV